MRAEPIPTSSVIGLFPRDRLAARGPREEGAISGTGTLFLRAAPMFDPNPLGGH